MANSEFTAVIELASSKIVGVAARKNDGGAIEVLASAKLDASAFIRRCIIYNIYQLAKALTTIIAKMEE